MILSISSLIELSGRYARAFSPQMRSISRRPSAGRFPVTRGVSSRSMPAFSRAISVSVFPSSWVCSSPRLVMALQRADRIFVASRRPPRPRPLLNGSALRWNLTMPWSAEHSRSARQRHRRPCERGATWIFWLVSAWRGKRSFQSPRSPQELRPWRWPPGFLGGCHPGL